MPSYTNQVDINFIYGSQGRKKRRRPSFWGCRPCRPRSSARDRHPERETPAKPTEPSSRSEGAPERSPSRPASNATRPGRHRLDAEHDTMDNGRDRPDYWPSPIGRQDYYSPRPPSSPQGRAPWPIMQPFRTLVAFVKRCPWAVVSDVDHRGQPVSDDVYYPSVPRSLLHDTAVSFVVKDHTRPDLPEFVISCPFEHVDLVHQLLAPDGSRRQLSARGASGQPRTGDQLRSMLLDGTPSIELALHTDVGGGVGRAGSRRRPWSGDDDGGAVASRRGSGGGWDTRRRDSRDAKDGASQHTSSMNEPVGPAEPPVVYNPDDNSRADEAEVEHARTNEALAAPFWQATPLRGPITPTSPSPLPPASEQAGSPLRYISPSPFHFQATVESAPSTPSVRSEILNDGPAADALEQGRKEDDGDEDQMDHSGDREQEGSGRVGEPPALMYVQPSPGQLERGVPLNGWLCDPEWLRRMIRDFTPGNMQGDQ